MQRGVLSGTRIGTAGALFTHKNAMLCLIIMCCAALAIVESSPLLCVSSKDNTLQVCVDVGLGSIVSIDIGNGTAVYKQVNFQTELGAASARVGLPVVSQASAGGEISITQNWTFAADHRAPAGAGAVVVDTLSSGVSSVQWHVRIEGTVAAPWSVPITTNASFGSDTTRLKLWSMWDRGAHKSFPNTLIDALQPSDQLESGWWDGCYRLGNPRGVGCNDFIVVPLVSVLACDGADAGLTLMLSPHDTVMDTWLYLQGSQGSFALQRTHYRIAAGSPVLLQADLVGHAGDWRAGLGWAVAAYAAYFEPANPEVFAVAAGTGSYSYYIGNLTSPSLKAMAYQVNWDLSGRFFPYMGQFLPPVGPTDVWLNDPEGSQPRANVSFAIIAAWYDQMRQAGFVDLSYFNVNEYGLNIVLPPGLLQSQQPPAAASAQLEGDTPAAASAQGDTPAAASAQGDSPVAGRDAAAARGSSINWSLVFEEGGPELDHLVERALGLAAVGDEAGAGTGTCAQTWQNASTCLLTSFPDALVTQSWDEVDMRLVLRPYYSWQNAVVVDPGIESYHAFMLEQLVRKIVMLGDGFAGITVDRSDWQETYNLAYDDGVSFVPEVVGAGRSGLAGSMKISYQRMIADLRAGFGAAEKIRQRARELLLERAHAVQASGVGSKVESGEQLAAAYRTMAGRLGSGLQGQGIMLLNSAGNGRLDNFLHYDGQFSEGQAVNGVGLLGVASPAVLWTYDANECCSTPARVQLYFQAHLYMGLCPMVPFPGNDHAIGWDNSVIGQYIRYGHLLRAIANKVWCLQPHIVGLVNGTGLTTAKVNAFVTVLDTAATAAGLEQALVVPVMLGLQTGGSVLLNMTGMERVWGPGHTSVHPLIRHRRAEAGLPKAPWTHSDGQGGAIYVTEVAYPGPAGWAPLQNSTCVVAPCSMLVRLTLVDGAAIVRVRRVAAP